MSSHHSYVRHAIDIQAVIDHVAAAIDLAAICAQPAPYVFVENVFPIDIYQAVVQAHTASEHALQSQIHRGDPKLFFGSYADRSELKVPEAVDRLDPEMATFWISLKNVLESDGVFDALVRKFESGFRRRFGDAIQEPAAIKAQLRSSLIVVNHKPNYFLGPHTDRFEKVVTCVFNLAENADLDHLGTAMYAPKEPGFTCDGRLHHDPAKFEHTHTVPFRPNSVLIFFREDQLFHGVEQLTAEGMRGSKRANLLFNFWTT